MERRAGEKAGAHARGGRAGAGRGAGGEVLARASGSGPGARQPREPARAAPRGQLPGGTWIAGRALGAEPPAPRRGRGGAQSPVPRKVTQRAAPGLGRGSPGWGSGFVPPARGLEPRRRGERRCSPRPPASDSPQPVQPARCDTSGGFSFPSWY